MVIEYPVLEILHLPSVSTWVRRGLNESSALKLETVGYHRTWVTFYHYTQCVIPKDSIMYNPALSGFFFMGRRK